jgi:hypothetical protein
MMMRHCKIKNQDSDQIVTMIEVLFYFILFIYQYHEFHLSDKRTIQIGDAKGKERSSHTTTRPHHPIQPAWSSWWPH